MVNHGKDLSYYFRIKNDFKTMKLKHSMEIYEKCHLTDDLFHYDLIFGRDILHQIGILFNFENKTITCQEVSISIYSRKLNPAQVNYTTTERELLSIEETLKELRNILLGWQIKVYTDHKNLTYKSFNTERVMRWRLILEEFSSELIYIKGSKNVCS